jgi:hypothetical protein
LIRTVIVSIRMGQMHSPSAYCRPILKILILSSFTCPLSIFTLLKWQSFSQCIILYGWSRSAAQPCRVIANGISVHWKVQLPS